LDNRNNILKAVKKSGKKGIGVNDLTRMGYDKKQINKLIKDGTLLKVAGLILLA
jgi:hypothetical protein